MLRKERAREMEREIREFIAFLHNTKRTSYNTEVSYQRDLKKIAVFLQERGISSFTEVRERDLEEYMRYMERENFASSTISRSVASIRALFHFTVALDADGRGLAAAGGIGLDGLDRAGDRGVDGRAVASLLAGDQLAHGDMVADLNDGLGRLAGVHVHRQQHLFGDCHAHGRHAGRAFVMG